jgi:hypothetical protein
MSEHFDPFEAELAALKPQQPSPNLHQRLADQLQDESKAAASSWSRFARQIKVHRTAGLTFATGLAACALAAFVLRPSGPPNVVELPSEMPQPPLAIALDDALPTVWAYQRALSRSPSELDALLDKHASLAPHAAPTPNHHLFIRSNRDLLLPGEL